MAPASRLTPQDPACYLHAFSPLPMPPGPRRGAYLALQTALSAQGVLAALLLTPEQVVAVATPKRQPIHPDDLFLLTNFVRASESFRRGLPPGAPRAAHSRGTCAALPRSPCFSGDKRREGSDRHVTPRANPLLPCFAHRRLSESFSPVCLPKFNASGFVYAYVGYLAPSICLVRQASGAQPACDLSDFACNTKFCRREGAEAFPCPCCCWGHRNFPGAALDVVRGVLHARGAQEEHRGDDHPVRARSARRAVRPGVAMSPQLTPCLPLPAATLSRDKVLLAVFNAMQRGPLMLSGLPKAAGSGPVGSTCLW